MTDARRLGLDDMDAAARVHRASFNQRLPWIANLHTPAEDSTFYRRHVFPTCAVWGVDRAGALVGIVAFREGWIEQLYVLPAWHRQGIGRALLAVAQRGSAGLRLWAFQRNAGARAFYEAHGFVAIEQTDGSDNEEREPDVLYEWTPVTRPG